MKHRKNKTKRQHSIIKGLDKLLDKVAAIDGVKAIIPGKISTAKTVKELHLTVQYKTSGGIKVIAKGSGVQEVFIVCEDADLLEQEIEKM